MKNDRLEGSFLFGRCGFCGVVFRSFIMGSGLPRV